MIRFPPEVICQRKKLESGTLYGYFQTIAAENARPAGKGDGFIFCAFLVSLYHLTLTAKNIRWNLMHNEIQRGIVDTHGLTPRGT